MTQFDAGRVSTGEKFGYGVGDLAISLYLNFFQFFLLYYFVDIIGLAPAAIGTMLLLTKLFDAVTDPAMGIVADRTRSRWGRYRGYLLWGALPFGLIGSAIFAAPDLGPNGMLVWAYVTYTLTMIAMTIVGVPYAALLGAISPLARERAGTAAYRMIFSSIGGILIGVAGTTLIREIGGGDERAGVMVTMFLISFIAVFSIWACFAATKERVPPAREIGTIRGDISVLIRNTSWLAVAASAILVPIAIASRAGSALFFFKYVASDPGVPVLLFLDRAGLFFTALALGQVTGVISATTLIRWFDKRTLLLVAGSIKFVFLVIFYFLPLDAVWLQTFIQLIIGIGFGMMMILAYAMFTDVAEHVEWQSGRQMTALVISASIFALKTGIAVGGAAPGMILALTGFDAGAAQSEASLFGINFAFTILPAMLILPAFFAVLYYQIDRKVLDRVERELAERRAVL